METGEFKAASLNDHPGAVVQRYLLYRLRERVLGQDAVEPLAAQAEQVFKARFPPAVAAQVDEAMRNILHAQSTGDVVKLVDRILAALQSGATSAQSEGNRPDPDRALSPDTASTQLGQSGPTPPQASDSPECDPATTPATPLEPTTDGTAQSALQGEVCRGPSQSAASRALEATADDLLPDLAEATRQRLGQQATAARPSDRWPALPRMVDLGPPGRDIDHRQALSMTARLRARLQGLLQTETLACVHLGRQGRRVSTRHLWRLKAGDGRVFRRRTEQPGLDTALQVLLDGSSSMRVDGASTLATEACYALMKALAGLPGIHAGAAVFYTPRGTREARLRVLTRLGEPVRGREYRAIATGLTPVAEALVWAASELASRREARRIVFVITDGEPDDESAVNRMRARLEGAGIELLGLGIQHDVSHLFAPAARVDTLGSLPRALFHLLERSLGSTSRRVA